MRNRDYARGYSAGYYCASRGDYHSFKPPLPPDLIVQPIFAALRKLRDEADSLCATISEDDEFAMRMGPLIDKADEAIERYAEWLRGKEILEPPPSSPHHENGTGGR